jgi:IMP dehydrogenase
VGIIVIDSSHGNCPAVIDQTKKIVKIAGGRAAVIAGNIADVDGYYRLALAGVDGVKCGIGSGSICTTSQVTGAGVPMFTLIRELSFAREKMIKAGRPAPAIIPDGGVNGPGEMVIALAAGGDACMAGKWLVAAKESLSCQERGVQNGLVYYRGMASREAIEKRVSDRYGKQKRAAEGVAGGVEDRGPLKTWIGHDLELVQGGFAHAGAKNMEALHVYGNEPISFVRFTSFGQNQIDTRVHRINN